VNSKTSLKGWRVTDLKEMKTVAFGPVPSRRLGRSLGINNIQPKFCSYSCVYCQIGKTIDLTIARRSFYKTEDIFKQVKRKVNETIPRNEKIYYLTFVADGEPTLDINLGNEISLLKQIGSPIAVITNSSLIWQNDTKEDLLEADFVSFKIDTVNEKLWKRINRPHKDLRLNRILEGISDFADEFRGTIISETMLIDGINYGDEFEKIAEFLKHLKRLDKAYIAIPTRPPTERWVTPAKEETVNEAFQVFAENLGSNKVKYLIGYEGNAFGFTGRVEEDLLSITSVHPMRKEAVKEFLRKTNTSWSIIEKLLLEDKLVELEYAGKAYYMRKLPSRNETK
jgi:wyosine [tRNA(Phe)-imidazoG37] synthetase (radical SAM superfamily)